MSASKILLIASIGFFVLALLFLVRDIAIWNVRKRIKARKELENAAGKNET